MPLCSFFILLSSFLFLQYFNICVFVPLLFFSLLPLISNYFSWDGSYNSLANWPLSVSTCYCKKLVCKSVFTILTSHCLVSVSCCFFVCFLLSILSLFAPDSNVFARFCSKLLIVLLLFFCVRNDTLCVSLSIWLWSLRFRKPSIYSRNFHEYFGGKSSPSPKIGTEPKYKTI